GQAQQKEATSLKMDVSRGVASALKESKKYRYHYINKEIESKWGHIPLNEFLKEAKRREEAKMISRRDLLELAEVVMENEEQKRKANPVRLPFFDLKQKRRKQLKAMETTNKKIDGVNSAILDIQKQRNYEVDDITILVRVAKYNKDYYLKIEAQGDYKNIGGVAREFTLKLRQGKNLVGKDRESGLKEYFYIDKKELRHYYSKNGGKASYENPIINEDGYSFVSLTDNKNILIFPYNAGLKISESGLSGDFSLEPKGKNGSVAIIKGDLFLFIGQHYGNTYYVGQRLQPHYRYSHNRYMVDLDETDFEVLSEGVFIGEYTSPKEVLDKYDLV
ncbi:10104_t:CDS:2, partial [Racocetra persica]